MKPFTKQSILFLAGILFLTLLFSSFSPISEGMDNDKIDGNVLVKELQDELVKQKANNVEEDELISNEEKTLKKFEHYQKDLENKEGTLVNKLKSLLGKLSGEEKQTLQHIITELSEMV